MKLALLCRQGRKLNLIEPIWDISELKPKKDSVMETGSWVVSEEKAKDLVGETLILCETRVSPAYVGGVIIDYTFERDEKGNPRTTFQFMYDPAMTGAHVIGWNEQNPVHYII